MRTVERLLFEKPPGGAGRELRACGFLAAAAVLSLWLITSSAGEEMKQGEPVRAEENLLAGTPSNVYLNDSFEAVDALARVEPWVRSARWTEAAELLQQTADRQAGKLIRIGEGHYVGLRRHIADVIASWPKPGIEAYRTLFERELDTLINEEPSPRRIPKWLEAFDRFFCTAAAAKLADRIGQTAIEAGQLTLAEHVYRRVLECHPDADSHRRAYGPILAVVWAMMGRLSFDGTQFVIDSPSLFPEQSSPLRSGTNSCEPLTAAFISSLNAQARLRWMGHDRPLGEVIAEIRTSFTATSAPVPEQEWPVFGGDSGRNRSSRSSVDELGMQWRASYQEQITPVVTTADETDALNDPDPARDLTAYPIASGGLIYVQRHREIFALHRTTGEISWRFRAEPVTSEQGGYVHEQPTGWDSVVIVAGRLYASLPGQPAPYYGYGSSRALHELICLDAATGQMLWRLDESTFETRFTEMHFDSAPLVEGNGLFVVGRRRRSFGFEDSYLMRFDAATGKLESQVHLGGASTGSFGAQQPTKSIIAAADGVVYVCTNLGTLAAVDAHTGEVNWLRLYPRQAHGSERVSSSWGSDVTPWQFNPVLVTPRGLISRPLDADHLFVNSRDDGRLLRSIPVEQLLGLQTLLGLHDGLICGVGKEVLCYDMDAGTLRWHASLPDGAPLMGRGVWTGDRILVPTAKFLCSYDLATGRRTDSAWGPEGESGNLLALPDQLIVAGGRHTTSYVRKADIWNALQTRLAAVPADPLPALELAEVALRSGEIKEALDALEEAIRRADLSDESLELTIQDRMFKNAMSFARTLSERGELTTERLDRMFTYAARYPVDAAAHLAYRLRFAALFEKDDRVDRTLRLYQQILQDRSLRDLPIDPRGANAPRAALHVQQRIAALLKQHGPSIYEPFETEAGRLLDAARSSRDRAGLERVASAFPNSNAAPRALIALGELSTADGQAGEAARQFIQAFHRYPGQVDRPNVLKHIADAYEASGHFEDAYRWLTKAALEHSSALIEHDGKLMTFAQYRERLARVRDRVEPTYPELVPPLDKQFVRSFDGSVTLLVPLFPADPASRWSAAYVYTPDGIRAIDPRRGVDLWNDAVSVQQKPELLIARHDIAVFATAYQLFALHTTTGAQAWSHGEYPRHIDDQGADWEQGDTFRAHVVHGVRLVSVRDQGTWSCMDMTTGHLLWSKSHQPPPLGRIAVNDRLVAYHTVQDSRNAICLLNATDGEWIDCLPTDEDRPIEALLITLDGQILLVTSQTITSYDPVSSFQRWNVQVDGHIRRPSLVLDVDSIYLSPDGRDLWKISLDDGRLLWETPGLLGRGDDDISVERTGAQLIASSSASIVSVDAVTGMILWRGVTPPKVKLRHRLLTRSFAVAINTPEPGTNDYTAYFYDLRNASGVIPVGGAPNLGSLEDIQRIMAADGSLLIQTGPTILQGVTRE